MSTTPFRSVLLGACLLAAGGACAQVAPPPPAPPVPAAGLLPPAPPPPPGPAAPGMPAPMPGAVLDGRIARWLPAPGGEADGILLADGTQVVFPPHLSSDLRRLAAPGASVRVTGWRVPGVPVLRLRSLEAGGRVVADRPPAPGALPPTGGEPGALQKLAVQGRIERLLYGERGEVRGVLLSDRSVVHVAPERLAAYGSSLRAGATFAATGWGMRGVFGTALEASRIGPEARSLHELAGAPGPAPTPARQPGVPPAP